MTANRRVAIVTGASRGIGQVVAMRLAADGFAVVVNFASSSSQADETVAVIHGKGGQAVAIRGDISDPDQVARLYAGAKEAFGRVDVVVNNAGIMTLAPIADGKLDDFDRTIAINLRGYLLDDVTCGRIFEGRWPLHRVVNERAWQKLSGLRRLHRLEGGR